MAGRVWLQDEAAADVHDLLEARRHLLQAGDTEDGARSQSGSAVHVFPSARDKQQPGYDRARSAAGSTRGNRAQNPRSALVAVLPPGPAADERNGGYLRAQLLFQPDLSTPGRPSRCA